MTQGLHENQVITFATISDKPMDSRYLAMETVFPASSSIGSSKPDESAIEMADISDERSSAYDRCSKSVTYPQFQLRRVAARSRTRYLLVLGSASQT